MGSKGKSKGSVVPPAKISKLLYIPVQLNFNPLCESVPTLILPGEWPEGRSGGLRKGESCANLRRLRSFVS